MEPRLGRGLAARERESVLAKWKIGLHVAFRLLEEDSFAEGKERTATTTPRFRGVEPLKACNLVLEKKGRASSGGN